VTSQATASASSAGDCTLVELKQKPAAAQTRLAADEDSVAVDPRHDKVEFQNDRVRVLRIHELR